MLDYPVTEEQVSEAFKTISEHVSATIIEYGDSSPEGSAALWSLLEVVPAWRAFADARDDDAIAVNNNANGANECAQA